MRAQFVVASIAAALVIGGVAGWFVADRSEGDDGVALARTSLTHFDNREVPGRDATWWNDGRDSLRFSPTTSGFTVEDYVVRVRFDGTPATKVEIAADSVLQPQTVAALPGSEGTTWVAVALPNRTAEPTDPTIRAVTWSGDASTATASSEIPIDVSADWNPRSYVDSDVALAQSGDTVSAIVAIDENHEELGALKSTNTALALCSDVTACRWEPLDLPDGADQSVVDIASTGNGYILVTGRDADRRQVWFADSGDLAWAEIDGATTDADPRLVQDGEGFALIVWQSREPHELALAVQSIDETGTVTTEVSAAHTPLLSSIGGVATHSGDWFIGGSVQGMDYAEVDLGYRPESARLLELHEDAWVSAGGDFLSSQLGQQVVALVSVSLTDHKLEIATTARNPAVDMIWGVHHLKDDE